MRRKINIMEVKKRKEKKAGWGDKEKQKGINRERKRRGPILFLTDYGLSDEYVGVVKCVIKNINPWVEIIDLTHDVKSHDIYHAVFVIQKSMSFFPANSVLLAVVDPGVGGRRKEIFGISRFQGKKIFFVGPDNGIFTPFYTLGRYDVYEIDGEKLRKSVFELTGVKLPSSSTFHGRDIFAPTSALLSLGVDEKIISKGKIHNPVILELPDWRKSFMEENESILEGYIFHIDKFGNLITNIPGNELKFLIHSNGEKGRVGDEGRRDKETEVEKGKEREKRETVRSQKHEGEKKDTEKEKSFQIETSQRRIATIKKVEFYKSEFYKSERGWDKGEKREEDKERRFEGINGGKCVLYDVPFVSSYEDVEKGNFLCIVGSWDTLEFSIREGSAVDWLKNKYNFDVSRFSKVVVYF